MEKKQTRRRHTIKRRPTEQIKNKQGKYNTNRKSKNKGDQFKNNPKHRHRNKREVTIEEQETTILINKITGRRRHTFKRRMTNETPGPKKYKPQYRYDQENDYEQCGKASGRQQIRQT